MSITKEKLVARKEQIKILIETETDLKVKNALINNLT